MQLELPWGKCCILFKYNSCFICKFEIANEQRIFPEALPDVQKDASVHRYLALLSKLESVNINGTGIEANKNATSSLLYTCLLY